MPAKSQPKSATPSGSSASSSARGSSAQKGRVHVLVSSASSRASSAASESRRKTASTKEAEVRRIVNSYGADAKKLLADIRKARERLLELACHQGKSREVSIFANSTSHIHKITKEMITSTGSFLQMLETAAKKRRTSRVSEAKAEERTELLKGTPEWNTIREYVTSATSYSPVYVLDSFVGLLGAIGARLTRYKVPFNNAVSYMKEHHVSTRDTVQYLCSFIKFLNLTRSGGYYEIEGTLLDAFRRKIVDADMVTQIENYLGTVTEQSKPKLLKEFDEWKNKTLFQYLEGRRRPSSKASVEAEMLAKTVNGHHYVSTSAGFTIAVICTVPLTAARRGSVEDIAKAIASAVAVRNVKQSGLLPSSGAAVADGAAAAPPSAIAGGAAAAGSRPGSAKGKGKGRR